MKSTGEPANPRPRTTYAAAVCWTLAGPEAET